MLGPMHVSHVCFFLCSVTAEYVAVVGAVVWLPSRVFPRGTAIFIHKSSSYVCFSTAGRPGGAVDGA